MDAERVANCKVAVLAGGWSDEREISLASGRACAKALTEAGFGVVDLLDVAGDDFVGTMARGSYDVAFVAMHGRYGEDGSIQGLLNIMHIPYTFSKVLASAVGTAKDVAKILYRTVDIPTPEEVNLAAGTQLDEVESAKIVEKLGLPLFVKPVGNGSSYGITRVTDQSQLPEAVALAGSQGDRVLIERCIEGMEITVPVLGNHDAQALPIVEVVTGSDFYDIKVKYEPAELHHVIPARLDPEVYQRAQEYAVRAHQVLGCRGVSRSDFIVTDDGVPYILETNTIPGMTETSLLPDSARHDGISFPELCKRIVELAFEESDI